MDFQIKLDNFEGPLDLLLHLIKKNRMDICSIAISRVTDEYLAAVNGIKNLDLEVAGEFLVMAATLIHIKSRTLLPAMETEPEEEDEDIASGKDLVLRLKEYEFFKAAAETLGRCSLLGRDEFINPARSAGVSGDDEPDYSAVGLYDLMRACRDLWGAVKENPCHQVEVGSLTVAQRIEDICLLLTMQEIIEVRQLFPVSPSHYQIVVTFLAVLELVRVRRIRLMQEIQFGPIRITPLR